jgi:hypothetical protein
MAAGTVPPVLFLQKAADIRNPVDYPYVKLSIREHRQFGTLDSVSPSSGLGHFLCVGTHHMHFNLLI